MTDIELVIRISKDIYQDIIENGLIYDEDNEEVTDVIKNGTPLPKGHGRLKDIDKIEWYGCTTAFDCPHKNRECKDCDRAECSKTQVDDIPIIIEADKEGE